MSYEDQMASEILTQFPELTSLLGSILGDSIASTAALETSSSKHTY